MKVCYLIDGLNLGGKEIQLFELIKGLLDQSFLSPEQIMIVSFNKEGCLDNIFQKMQIPIKYATRKFRKDLILLSRLNKIVKEFNPDIIHTWDLMTSFYTTLLKLSGNFIFIDGSIRMAPSRSGISFKLNFMKSLNFFCADTVVANSRAGLISFKAPLNKSLLIHNGYDKSRLKNLENSTNIKRRFGIKTNKVIGMVANFTDNKDYDTFISAAQIILENRNDVTFVAVGDGIKLGECKKMAMHNSNIKFLGTQKNVESIINIFDVGVLSTFTEGISNSVMEYMALGKPVVVTDGGGTNELVIDGKTGFLVKQKSPGDLAEKIQYLLNHRESALNMGKAGKKRIENEFNSEKMVCSYFELYSTFIKSKGVSFQDPA